MHLQEKALFDLDLWAKVTRNVAQYPLHHVTYSAAKFEVATSNRLGRGTFTRKYTTAGDWDCAAAVERLPALHYSVDFSFLSFGIMGFIVEL